MIKNKHKPFQPVAVHANQRCPWLLSCAEIRDAVVTVVFAVAYSVLFYVRALLFIPISYLNRLKLTRFLSLFSTHNDRV